jgi:hypothetical protein
MYIRMELFSFVPLSLEAELALLTELVELMIEDALLADEDALSLFADEVTLLSLLTADEAEADEVAFDEVLDSNLVASGLTFPRSFTVLVELT